MTWHLNRGRVPGAIISAPRDKPFNVVLKNGDFYHLPASEFCDERRWTWVNPYDFKPEHTIVAWRRA
jgi:hypothetical protein